MRRAYQGDWMDAIPSRFINELPESNIEKNENLENNQNDNFDFNQDNTFEAGEEYRSPGWDRLKKRLIKWEKIKRLRNKLKLYQLDGYIIPKNDEYFGEYVPHHKDNLKYISNFTGSYGIALILKSENILLVDGRYTVQANNQSGSDFKILTLPLCKKIFLKSMEKE